jgi:hypothetical protein
MEFDPTVKKSLAVIASVAGLAALSGCSTHDVNVNPRNQGDFGKNSWTYPDNKAGDRLQASCVGNALYIRSLKDAGQPDSERTWLNDPACEDGQLGPDDNIASAVAEAAVDYSDF